MLGGCKQCGKPVSDQAARCPHCGQETPFKAPLAAERSSEQVVPREPDPAPAFSSALPEPPVTEAATSSARLGLIYIVGFLVVAVCVMIFFANAERIGDAVPEERVETQSSAVAVQPPGSQVTEREALPPVDAALLGAPNDLFIAIEPSEVGVFGAPSVMEALGPLLGPAVTEGSSVHLSLREEGANTIADIVRTGLADDFVSAGHVRIEFRQEADGWYPTNAYRRMQCVRGSSPGEWTTGLCP